MSPNTPGTLSQEPTRTAKALALVSVLLAALTLLLLVISLSGLKTKPAWQKALPTSALSANQAGAALLKAGNLFEAEVRPRLIKAGLGSPADMANLLGGDSPSLSQRLTEKLWTLRAFPEAQAILLQGLLETERDPRYRQERFFGMYNALADVAQAILPESDALPPRQDNSKADSANPFAAFTVDPALKNKAAARPEPASEAERLAAIRKDQADQALRTALARRFLAILADDMQRAEEERLTRPEPQTDAEKLAYVEFVYPVWTRNDIYRDDAGRALATLYAQQDKPYFAPLAFAFLESGEGAPEARYRIIPLMVKKPGLPLAEYLAWSRFKSDLDGITRCLGTEPAYLGYLIGCCDDFGTLLQRHLKERGILLLGGKSGPGIAVEKTDAPSLEGHEGESGLYLLADMRHALENAPGEELRYDLSRAYPVFANSPLRHLENQPLLLPLDLKRPEDAALFAWYRDEAAGEGRLLLFAAEGSPEAVAGHLADLHLMWWPQSPEEQALSGNDKPDLSLMHIESGPFMLGVLPNIKGEAASRFLGPIRALWFLQQGAEQDQWYEARPEPALPRLSSRAATPAFLISRDIDEAFDLTTADRFVIELSRRLLQENPDPAMTRKQAFDSVKALDQELYDWGLEKPEHREEAILLFWRFQKDDAATEPLRGILAQQELSVRKRLHEARRALGIMEEKQ